MRLFIFSFFIATWQLSLGNSIAADWPLYRGDDRATGCATEKITLPESLKSVWEYRPESGWFQASPVIVDSTVYVGSSDDGMLAVNLDDGKLRWKYAVEYGVLAPAAYHKDAIGNESLFFGDTDGTLHVVDAKDGKLRWKFATKGPIDNSPNIDRKTDRVLVGSQDGSLYALETATGKLVWEYKAEDQIRCFPAIVERRCFVAGCDSKFHVVDLDKGTVVAKVEILAPTGSTPMVLGDRAFFGTEGNEFLALDWKKAEIIWRYEMKQAVRSPAAGKENTVVFCGMDRAVRALDAETGKERWTFRTKGRMENSGPIVVGSRVYVPCSDSFLYVLDLETGKQIQATEMPGKLTACPAVVDGRIVLGTDDGVLCCLGE